MGAFLDTVLSRLRDGAWLTPARARGYCRLLAAATVVGALAWIALSRDGVDVTGKPLGTDFISFWSASKLALAGRPEAAYDVAAHGAVQTALFHRDVGYTAFFYPPPFLLICLPLAALPYLWSLLAWLAVTGYAYLRAVRAQLDARLGVLPILAFPAVILNAGHGQNGFLSAALMGGGAYWLNASPLLAGACFGALVFKPHLALIVPFALVVSGRWHAFAAAAASAAMLTGASWAVLGTQSWQGFFADADSARRALELNLVGYEKMPSIFAAARLLHGGLTLAYALQIAFAVCACLGLVALHRRAPRDRAEGPAIVLASLMASPFVLDYDLTLLAIPMAWMASEGVRAGFRPWEKTTLAACFALPLASRALAGALDLPVAPLLVAVLFALLIQRDLAAAASAKAMPAPPTARDGLSVAA